MTSDLSRARQTFEQIITLTKEERKLFVDHALFLQALRDFGSSDADTATLGLKALGNLCEVSRNRSPLKPACFIVGDILVRFGGDTDTAREACVAVAHLAWNCPGNQDALADVCKEIAELLQLFGDNDPQVAHAAAFAITLLTKQHERNRALFSKLNVFEPLIKGAMTRYENEPKVINYACFAIGNLAENTEAREKLCKAGACERVLRALKHFSQSSVEVVRAACYAVMILARDDESIRSQLCELDACQIVPDASSFFGKSNHGVSEEACYAIANLAQSKPNQVLLESSCDFVVDVLNRFGTSQLGVARSACCAVALLARDNEKNRVRLGEARVRTPLINALTHFGKESAEVANYGCSAVGNLLSSTYFANDDFARAVVPVVDAAERFGKADAHVARSATITCERLAKYGGDSCAKKLIQYDGGKCVMAIQSAFPAMLELTTNALKTMTTIATRFTFTTHASLDDFIEGMNESAWNSLDFTLRNKWQAMHYYYLRRFRDESVKDSNYFVNFPGHRCFDCTGKVIDYAVVTRRDGIMSAVTLTSDERKEVCDTAISREEWTRLEDEVPKMTYVLSNAAKTTLGSMFIFDPDTNELYRPEIGVKPTSSQIAEWSHVQNVWIVPCKGKLEKLDAVDSKSFREKIPTGPPHQKVSAPRILCLDGGTVNGTICAIRFLIELERRIKILFPDDGNLLDCFDMVCGTGLGAAVLLCFMYGWSPNNGGGNNGKLEALDMKLADVLDLFLKIKYDQPNSEYDYSKFEDAVRGNLGGVLMLNRSLPNCLIASTMNIGKEDFFFCNYGRGSSNSHTDFLKKTNQTSAWVALKASASDCLNPIQFWGRVFDCGVGNPSAQAWLEAKTLLNAKAPACFLSLSCTTGEMGGTTVGETVHRSFKDDPAMHEAYFRLDVQDGIPKMIQPDAKELKRLFDLECVRRQSELKAIVQKLCGDT